MNLAAGSADRTSIRDAPPAPEAPVAPPEAPAPAPPPPPPPPPLCPSAAPMGRDAIRPAINSLFGR